MKNIFKRFSRVAVVIFLLVGCTDHLEVDTFDTITGSGFWNTPADARSYAVGIHSSVFQILDGDNNTMNWTDGRSDLFIPGALGPRLTSPAQLHTQTSQFGGGNWRAFYNSIHHCNLLLNEIENITFNEDAEKTKIMAQGYFFRAFLYFELVRIYGPVPLITEPTAGKPAVEDLLSRTSVDEVFVQIKSDVDLAINGMPDGIPDKNFISKAAALALKAEVYMWTAKALEPRGSAVSADLNTAIAAIDAIPAASDGAVSFHTGDWIDIFTRQGNDSPEYIWATYYDYLTGTSDNVFDAITLRIDNVPDTIQGLIPIAVQDEGLNRIQVDAKMNTIFDKYQTVDPHDNPFSPNDDGGPFYDRRDLRDVNSIIDVLEDQTTIVMIKFPGILVPSDESRYWDNDIPIYRWSGMLLLKAEALNTLGQTSEAVTILNMTRNRAGLADYSGAMDQATLEDEILDERARELLGENKRWWDLIRAHKVAENVPRFMSNRGDDSSDQNVWDFYYWPLDEGVLLQNQQLVQSAGY